MLLSSSHPVSTLRRLCALLSLLLSGAALYAAPGSDDIVRSGGGMSWVLAFPDTTMTLADPRLPHSAYADDATIAIYSAVDNRISIRGAGYTRTVTLPAGRFTVINLMDPTARAGKPIVTETNIVNDATFRLDADQPVILYCWLLTRHGAEAWAPIPVEWWGKEYFAAARPGEVAIHINPGIEWGYNVAARRMAPAEITIVAAYDDTRITIAPTGKLLYQPRLTDVVLQANEVYQVQSFVDTTLYFVGRQTDLGGSRITSTKPIGVISGNTRAQVVEFEEGEAQNSFKNMLVEWLSPVEQHGVEFVYLPTSDIRKPTGIPVQDTAGRRKGEHVRIYSTAAGVTTGYSLDWNGRRDFTLSGPGKFHEEFITVPEARYYRVDRPAQAMMNSSAVFRYSGSTDRGESPVRYDSWGAYMVELVPRERWSSFTPYHAPARPAGMLHYINVVVDSAHRFDVYTENGSRFVFNGGVIGGTDLVWGTLSVAAGRDGWLEGRNGARFSGHLYGLLQGVEDSHAEAKEEKESDGGMLSAPVLYEERLAASYGYPLPSRRGPFRTGDSLEITTATECSTMTIDARAINADPVGLHAVRLDSSVNTRIVSLAPRDPAGGGSVRIVVAPVDPSLDASAIVVITDRTGKTTRVRYAHIAERLTVDPSSRPIDFGTLSPGFTLLRTITLVNPLDRAIILDDLRLSDGSQDYSVVAMTSELLPLPLAVGESFEVTIRYAPTHPSLTYRDTLRLTTRCSVFRFPLVGKSASPVISVSDVDFGVVPPGESRTLPMRICNGGTGEIGFRRGIDSTFLRWLGHREEFTVEQSDIDRIAAARIAGSDSCLTIMVTFRSEREGIFRDTARLFPLYRGRSGDDMSIWSARAAVITGVDRQPEASRPVVVSPNPMSGAGRIEFSLERPSNVRLVIVDGGGRERGVVEQDLPVGRSSLSWDTTTLPAGIYFYRLETDDYTASGSIVVVR